jgi:RNA polymerase sigma-70 factor (ECF subfamily)
MHALMAGNDTRNTGNTRLERARQGDRAAFDELAGACRDRLRTLVRFRLGASLRREVDPEDVVQETLLRAFRTIGRFTSRSEDSFFRWLSGIARNVILERCRSVQPAADLDALDTQAESASPSRALRRRERLDRLQRALNELSPEYRRVLRGVLVEKLPLTEIARRMGRTPNAVSLLLLRANRKLRESFGDTQSLGLPAAELDWGESDVAR